MPPTIEPWGTLVSRFLELSKAANIGEEMVPPEGGIHKKLTTPPYSEDLGPEQREDTCNGKFGPQGRIEYMRDNRGTDHKSI